MSSALTSSASASIGVHSEGQLLLGRPVYVFGFAPVPHVYSVSPFAIKLESWLRINKIPYHCVYPKSFSSKRQMPYIKFDDAKAGEEVPDSNVIIRLLQELLSSRGHDHTEVELSSREKAIIHMLTRMVEEHTTQICFYYRYGLHMSEFLGALDIEHRFRPGIASIWEKYQPETTKDKTAKRGLSRHCDEEVWGFSNDDIQALADYLGESKYFCGKKATLADCVVFGHLSQFLWIPIDFPQKQFMHDHCPKLVAFMEHFREEYWPDWQDLCNIQLDFSKESILEGNHVYSSWCPKLI